jgi:hypothetical protein
MGFLDFLFDKEQAEKKRLTKMQKTISNMYVQATERQFVLSELKEMNTVDSFKVLLARFNESSHNSTVDLEEKEYVHAAVVEMARHNPDYVPIIRQHVIKAANHINWPMKVLSDIYTAEEMADFLRELLESAHLEYERDPEKKQEVILRAAEFKNEKLAKEVGRFMEDANETIRYMTVETLIAQDFDFVAEPLSKRLPEEDSLRIIQKIVQAFASRRHWKISEEDREAVSAALPAGYSLHKDGYIHARRS